MSEETEKKEGKKTEEQRFEYRASEMYYAGSLDFMYACRTGDAVFSGAGLMFIYGSIEEGKYFEDSSEYFILTQEACLCLHGIQKPRERRRLRRL